MDSTTSSSGSTTPSAPPWLQKLLKASGKNATALMNAVNAAGGVQQQLTPSPDQTAQLSPEEQQLISELGSFGSGANPDVQAAENQLTQLTSGPIGSSPATEAAMRAYETNVAPTILNSVAMAGTGRGGGITQATTQGEEQAYVPLVQQEIANRENAVGQYNTLANTNENMAMTGLQAEDIPRQIQQQQFDAAYQDMLRRYQLQQEATLGPLQEFGGNEFGSNSTGTSTTSQPWYTMLF